MTPLPNGVLDALPNVLRTQTVPNTLGGVGPPASAAALRLPTGAVAAAIAVTLAAVAILFGRSG